MQAAERALSTPPRLQVLQDGEAVVAIDTHAPHWIVTDSRGKLLLDLMAEGWKDDAMRREYAHRRRISDTQAWLECDTFLNGLSRVGFDVTAPSAPYRGRGQHAGLTGLTELWIHLNDACNLRCRHCLVNSAPGLSPGLPPDRIAQIISQAAALGVRRFLFTGGEPFARRDIVDRIAQVTEELERDLIVLTNGTLLKDKRLHALQQFSPKRLHFQVSVDGPTAAVNDAVRGAGSFDAALQGIDRLVALGFDVTVTVVAHRLVLPHLEQMADLAARHQAKALHVLWPHRRGRAFDGDFLPAIDELIRAYRRLRARARSQNLVLDNDESLRARLDGLRGVKTDLSNAGWESLCVYTDAGVYPSAATAGIPELCLGSLEHQTLQDIWRHSAVGKILRDTSVVDRRQCGACPYRFLCGGGDIEHAYFHAHAGSLAERLLSDDPYSPLYQAMIAEVLMDEARERLSAFPYRSGFNRPVVAYAMGEDGLVCGADREMLKRLGMAAVSDKLPVVRFGRSACVLSVDVVDRSRMLVQEFYGHAAAEPQAELCCPVRYDADDTSHIPAEVLDRFYGCGGPMSTAQVQPGETVVDLGSGGGIDCFIAARKVGASGRVIGIDMTDGMLEVARANQHVVAERLGWDVVSFRKGFLEQVPVEDRSADLVTSNCVINLSPDKSAVFREMWRVLKDHGRVVLSDIVSEDTVPPHLRFNPRLWGECISGAMSEREFLALLERAGFYGISILRKSFWKEVEGHAFYAATVRGYKFEKTQGCVFVGQKATYLGPLKAAVDEEGHLFPRGEWLEVCTDTASKLRHAPYNLTFAVAEPGEERHTPTSCDPSSGCC